MPSLTANQRAMWLFQRANPSSTAYHIGGVIRLRAALEPARFERAIGLAFRRHPSLRATFPDRDGEPICVILEHPPAGHFRWESASPDSTEEDRQAQIASFARQSFSLEQGPLARLQLLSISSEEHLVACICHHLIADLHSFSILMQEIPRLYHRPVEEGPSDSRDWEDFVDWQAGFTASERGRRDLRFWRQCLPAPLPSVDLGSPRGAPAASRQLARPLSEATGQTVRELAAAAGASVQAVILAGWLVVIGRHSGQRRLVVAVPRALRNRERHRDLLGLLTNTVLVSVELRGGETFRELVVRVAQALGRSLRHGLVPFAELTRHLAVEGGPSAPYFSSMVAFYPESEPASALAVGRERTDFQWQGWPATLERMPETEAHCDVLLLIAPAGGRLYCELRLAADRKGAAFAAVALDHLERLFALADADSVTAYVDWSLTAVEDLQAIDAWNATSVPWDGPPLIHECIARQARSTPLATVAGEHQELTFLDLERRSRILAGHLAGMGVTAESRVGILMRPSPERTVALLGVLRAGAAFVPFEIATAVALGPEVVNSAPLSLLIGEPELLGELPFAGPKCALEELSRQGTMDEVAAAPADPAGIAYVLFTSGSTGPPKGAMLPHAGLHNRILWMREALAVTSADVVLHKTPLTFDVALWEVFLPLAAGARSIVAERGEHQDPHLLIELMARRGVTIVHFVPTLLRAFVRLASAASCPTLRCMVASGEALDADLCEEVFAAFPAMALYNLYGPTEASIDVSFWRCQPGWREPVPIGRPVANTRLYVLDPEGRIAPLGTAGELHVGGVGLARGYVGRAALTAERFRPAPVGPGERVYATGDRARQTSAGLFEFLGRVDRQVKIAGNRVELDRVEQELTRHPDIATAAVIARTADGSLELEAFVVLRREIEEREMRAFLARRLRGAAIPRTFTRLDELPRLASGKIDYSGLARLVRPGPADGEARAAADPLEELLRRAWQRVLGVADIGRFEDFFALGGDSIRAIQVQAMLARQGWTFRSEDLVRHPTLATLAPLLDRVGPAPPRTPFALLEAGERVEEDGLLDAFPLSSVQESLLYHSRVDPSYEIYTLALRFSGRFCERSFRRAVDQLHRRHDLLRLAYVMSSRMRLIQAVRAAVEPSLEIVDARLFAPAAKAELLSAWLAAERRLGFDWKRAPLVRFTVHVVEDQLFQLTLSHPFLDGWSVAALVRELMESYREEVEGVAPADRPPAFVFRRFVELERQALDDSASQRFWQTRLAAAEPMLVPLPFYLAAPARRQTRELPRATAEALLSLAAATGLPLKSLLLAIHLRVLAVWSGRRDVLTAALLHGRPEELESDRAMGMFLNPVPLGIEVEAGADWCELGRLVWQAEKELWAHRRFPFAAMGPRARHGVDTAFNFIHFHNLELLRHGSSPRLVEWSSPTDPTYFALTAYFHLAAEQRLFFHLDTAGGTLEGASAERLASLYESAIEACARAPHAVPSNLALLPPEELRRQLEAWNATDRDWGEGLDRPAPLLFDSVAFKAGSAPCLTHRGATWSYAWLAAQKRRLAIRLGLAGWAGRGAVIGLLIEPGPAWAVGVLGILAAGAAFLPLDPESPPGRLRWMLESAGAVGLVTDDPAFAAREIASFPTVEIELEAGPEEVAEAPAPAVLGGDDLAYVLYTSGSTGDAKAVAVGHGSLTNLLLAMRELTGFGAGSSILSVTPPSFDISILELLLPLVCGGRLVIGGRDLRRDPIALQREMAKEEPTLMQATPSTWRLLIAAGWTGDPTLDVLCGGDRLPRPLADQLLARSRRIWNVYGPTEATIWCTAERVSSGAAEPTVGRPLANTRVYVLNAELEPLPVGAVGWLHVGGRAVAQGYLSEPVDRQGAFRPNPFAPGRLYATGDRACFAADGRLVLLGRRDDQIKLRGIRLHLAEVEKAIERLAGVTAAVVVPLGEPPTGLVAWAVAAGREAAALRAELEQHLPPILVPGRIELVPELPRSPHGKVDRAALMLRARELPAGPGDGVAAGPVAASPVIAEVLATVLGAAEIGAATRLDALGADSLTFLRLALALEARGLQISVSELMACATIGDLEARFVRNKSPGDADERGRLRRAALRIRQSREKHR